MPHIYIIGMMGCGKTSLGRKLAHLINYPFVDTDDYIVRHTGLSITDIFAQEGAEGFRAIEHKALETLSQRTDAHVISTGGGLPCHHHNMDTILQTGYSIYLQGSPQFLYSRLRKRQHLRPLIAGKNKAETLHTLSQLLHERHSYYERAQLHIEAIQAKANKLLCALQHQTDWQWQGKDSSL